MHACCMSERPGLDQGLTHECERESPEDLKMQVLVQEVWGDA